MRTRTMLALSACLLAVAAFEPPVAAIAGPRTGAPQPGPTMPPNMGGPRLHPPAGPAGPGPRFCQKTTLCKAPTWFEPTKTKMPSTSTVAVNKENCHAKGGKLFGAGHSGITEGGHLCWTCPGGSAPPAPTPPGYDHAMCPRCESKVWSWNAAKKLCCETVCVPY
jgi:hypothetical protein